jgi:hypothetical protein
VLYVDKEFKEFREFRTLPGSLVLLALVGIRS